MAALELALVLLVTVLASSVLDQLIPRLSLPLIQIALGIALAVVAQERITITLSPELFLVLFIAPLLFYEAREANTLALWRNRSTMLSYAIGLVIAIVLVVGFVTHLLIPSIPLAAAFALGAALGPTDPIAVAAVSQRADIPARQQTTLKGESLLNDASGIVSFQFAVAAVVTGSFSLVEALADFLLSFFGALVVGIILGYALVKFADKMRALGLENTTFHVSLEIVTPFMAYLIGEGIGVSGVILVVACGITMSLVPSDLGPSISRLNIVSSSVWQVIAFALNGIVFVMLGTQLPQSLGNTWADEGIGNFELVCYILIITALMHGMRFLWSLASDAVDLRKSGESIGLLERVRLAGVTTFSGSKGAITLAIMFTMPLWINSGGSIEEFPQRDLLIFLASGVILVSLLLATFVVPLLAPRKGDKKSEQRERDDECRIEIFRAVIEELTARQTSETRRATSQVIALYNDRIDRQKAEADIDEDASDQAERDLRIKVLQWEQDFVLKLIEDDEAPPLDGYQYLSRIARIEAIIKNDRKHLLSFGRAARRLALIARKAIRRLRNKMPGETPESSSKTLRDIQLKTSKYIVDRLQSEMAASSVPTETISKLVLEYQRTIRLLRRPEPSMTAIANAAEPDLEVTRLGLRIELEQIQQAYEDGRLSRTGAMKMRENVYIMQLDLEDYL